MARMLAAAWLGPTEREGLSDSLAISLTSLLLLPLLLGLGSWWWLHRGRGRGTTRPSIAFFHPFAHCGGGGERVLWTAIHGLQALPNPPDQMVIYIAADAEHLAPRGGALTSNDAPSSQAILHRVEEQFNLRIRSQAIRFVYLHSVRWLEPSAYPRLTLIGQSLGSLVTGFEALWHCCPHTFVDTTGFAFVYPLARYVFGCRVIAYVHYPTISLDMLGKVESATADFNNDPRIAGSRVLSGLKALYYRAFARVYGLVGRAAGTAMVNSTWTRNHIDGMWDMPERTFIVYPPCDAQTLLAWPLAREPIPPALLLPLVVEQGEDEAASPSLATAGVRLLLSIAQFRPEKAHALQIEAFADVFLRFPEARLVLVGGCRNAEDRARVHALRQLIHTLHLVGRVGVVENAPSDVLHQYLRCAEIGLHTMRDEHFGISLIEYMAAGVIPIAHGSGGPKADIVVSHQGQATGFLACTRAEYAEAMVEALSESPACALARRQAGRALVREKFGDAAFRDAFTAHVLGRGA